MSLPLALTLGIFSFLHLNVVTVIQIMPFFGHRDAMGFLCADVNTAEFDQLDFNLP